MSILILNTIFLFSALFVAISCIVVVVNWMTKLRFRLWEKGDSETIRFPVDEEIPSIDSELRSGDDDASSHREKGDLARINQYRCSIPCMSHINTRHEFRLFINKNGNLENLCYNCYLKFNKCCNICGRYMYISYLQVVRPSDYEFDDGNYNYYYSDSQQGFIEFIEDPEIVCCSWHAFVDDGEDNEVDIIVDEIESEKHDPYEILYKDLSYEEKESNAKYIQQYNQNIEKSRCVRPFRNIGVE